MAKVKTERSAKKCRPALNPDAREKQLISRAMDLAEQQLIDGTASSQIIAHFLKRGSMKEQLEMERLREENRLLKAKTEAIESGKDIKELYENAIKAMQMYSGHGEDNEEY